MKSITSKMRFFRHEILKNKVFISKTGLALRITVKDFHMEIDMPIDTTLYVHQTTLRLIDAACVMTGIRRGQLVVLLLVRAILNRGKALKSGSATRYQTRDRREMWRTIHVRMLADDADYFRDARCFFNESVSLILAQAAREYLREILQRSRSGEKVDNYPLKNYIICREERDGLIFWHICWGFPEKPEKYFRL